MKRFERIMCPVDLSENSSIAIQMATALASQHDATLVLTFVGMRYQPEVSLYSLDKIEADKKLFFSTRPTDDSVAYEHIYATGNPGPEILKAAKSCDLIVMSTHGNTGMMRLLMGSVAEYVVRHAKCPVMAVKNRGEIAADRETLDNPSHVTEVMRHVHPVHRYDCIDAVLEELERVNETGTPVVDDDRKCIGILTRADIEKYRDLKRRFEAGDESVVDEVFETNKYGIRRADNIDFDQVHRHMTAPVVVVDNQQSCVQAAEVFADHPSIHHLVVLDSDGCPVGILETGDVAPCDKQQQMQ